MVKQKLHSALMLCAAVGVLAACQDAPTIATPGVAHSARGLHLGEIPFYCTLGRSAPSTPTGWETRTDTLFFPRAELDEGGRTIRYEYKRSFPDGRPLTAASCVVPYTHGALRRVDRFLGVEKGGGADQFRARQEMVTTQDCVIDRTACALDPVVVIAPPPEPSDLPTCSGCEAPFPGTSRPGGGDGSGYGGGTGGDGDSTPAYAPPGVTQDEFETLNPAEKKLCWANPIDCVTVLRSGDYALSWAAAQTGEGAHNGAQDALRHTMWNAQMARRMDATRAKAWADAHETSSQDEAETRMDLWNNHQGRWVAGNFMDLEHGVRWMWQNGKLCLAVGNC